MPTPEHASHTPERSTTTTPSATSGLPLTAAQPAAPSLVGGLTQPHRLTPAAVLQLQRHAGNRAVTHLVRGGPVVQTKLTVGPVGDRFEQEADRIARQVVEGPAPRRREEEGEAVATTPGSALQRSASAFDKQLPIQRHHGIRKPSEPVEEEQEEEEEVQRSPLPGATAAAPPASIQRHHGIRKPSEPVEEEMEEEEEVQRSPLPGASAAAPPASIQRHHSIRKPGEPVEGKAVEEEGEEGPVQRRATRGDGSFAANGDFTKQLRASLGRGRPLPGDVRRHVEPRMGADFGHVRVHTGPDAVQMSRDIHAEAFTHGSHIYFGANKFQPGSKQGQHLLAHELTHVVQQTGAPRGLPVQRELEPRIQRKWRTPKQWWNDKKTEKEKQKAELDTVDYDSLQGLKRGQVLPEVGKMAERRMKDMMKYDETVISEEARGRFGQDALTLVDDEGVRRDVIEKVTNDPEDKKMRTRFKMPDPSEEHFNTLATVIRQICPDYDPAKVPSGGGVASWLTNQIPNGATHRSVVIKLAEEFVRAVTAYSKQHAQYSAKGLRPEAKYENIPGMSQVETFVEERKNVQFKQVTVPPQDIPRWAAAMKQMDAIKALLDPDTAPPVNQEVGWRGGGKLGDKFDWVKDVRKAKIVGPLATHLDNKRARSTKIFDRFAQVDALMRRIVEPEMLGRVPVPTFHISTRGAQTFTNPFGLRASAARGEVNIAYNEDMPTIAHEVGHIVEEYLPMDDWADIHMLLSERHKAAGGGTRAAKGENIFTRNEGRYKGKYVTSKYTSRAYTKDNAEVLSMWTQFMAKPDDALKLIDGDPQHAALILRMMRPADYAKTTALRPFDIYLPNPTGDEGPLARYKKAQQKTMDLFKM